MSSFLGFDDLFEENENNAAVASELDRFVIERRLEETARAPQRDPAPPLAEREDLLEALQELGTALRKERAATQDLRSKLERALAHHSKQVSTLQSNIQTLAENERKSKAQQEALEQKEKALESRLQALEKEKQELQAGLTRGEQDRAEEIRKLRFEAELMKSGQEHHARSAEQYRKVAVETRAHYDRLRSQAEGAARAYHDAEQRNRALLGRVKSLDSELEASKARLAELEKTTRRATQGFNEAALKMKTLQERSLEQARKWTADHTRLRDLESSVENERNEKHMVLACLRSAEAKIGQRDEQIAYLTKELESLRNWNARTRAARPGTVPPSAPVMTPETLDAEKAKKLYEQYFVAYPAADPTE